MADPATTTQAVAAIPEMAISISAIAFSLLGTIIGWAVVSKQNRRQSDRQETWQLLQTTLTLIDEVADASVCFHHRGQGQMASLQNELDKVIFSIATLFPQKNELASNAFFSFKESITQYNWWTKNHTLYPLDSDVIANISKAQANLRKVLLDSYQQNYKAKRLR